jgi:hypothetical protein
MIQHSTAINDSDGQSMPKQTLRTLSLALVIFVWVVTIIFNLYGFDWRGAYQASELASALGISVFAIVLCSLPYAVLWFIAQLDYKRPATPLLEILIVVGVGVFIYVALPPSRTEGFSYLFVPVTQMALAYLLLIFVPSTRHSKTK